MASEFYKIPVTTKEHGLTGYFLSPETGVIRTTISGQELGSVATDEQTEILHAIPLRPESEQWIQGWEPQDYERLGLELVASPNHRPRKRIRIKGDNSRRAEIQTGSQGGEFNKHSDGLKLPSPSTFS
jgi:hypothetical protein